MVTAADPSPRVRPLSEVPALVERTVGLLGLHPTWLPLDADESAQVAAHMGLVTFAPGSVMLREGDQQRADYLLLVLEGSVQVETAAGGTSIPISVLGPGSVIGEMSMLDGTPRSATCVALDTVRAAGLSRKRLELLIDQHPRAAAKLLIWLAQGIGDRLRAMGQQVQIYAQFGSPPAATS